MLEFLVHNVVKEHIAGKKKIYITLYENLMQVIRCFKTAEPQLFSESSRESVCFR